MHSGFLTSTGFERVRAALKYAIISIVTFFVMQAVVVVMHELTHSAVAWLFGYMANPFDIVWGNLLTAKGWDEGVNYSDLKPLAEAIVGVSPLILHTIIVSVGLAFMRKGMPKNRRLFYLLFWFVVENFTQLFIYITMYSFIARHGDIGHFTHGLGLSPWVPFIGGSLALVFGLYILFGEVIQRMYTIFARGNRLTEWLILIMPAFILFLWGSAIRVISDAYPHPQWMFALIGFAAFGFVIIACNPSRRMPNSAIKN